MTAPAPGAQTLTRRTFWPKSGQVDVSPLKEVPPVIFVNVLNNVLNNVNILNIFSMFGGGCC